MVQLEEGINVDAVDGLDDERCSMTGRKEEYAVEAGGKDGLRMEVGCARRVIVFGHDFPSPLGQKGIPWTVG